MPPVEAGLRREAEVEYQALLWHSRAFPLEASRRWWMGALSAFPFGTSPEWDRSPGSGFFCISGAASDAVFWLCIRARLKVGPYRSEKELGFSPCSAAGQAKTQRLKPRSLLGSTARRALMQHHRGDYRKTRANSVDLRTKLVCDQTFLMLRARHRRLSTHPRRAIARRCRQPAAGWRRSPATT